jgi:hypothetical protein
VKKFDVVVSLIVFSVISISTIVKSTNAKSVSSVAVSNGRFDSSYISLTPTSGVIKEGVKYWLDLTPEWPGVYYYSDIKDKCLYGGLSEGGADGHNCTLTRLPNLTAGVKYWLDLNPQWPGVYYYSNVKNKCLYGGVSEGGADGHNCTLVSYKFSANPVSSQPTATLVKETSGTVNGLNKEVSMGGGYAEAQATFYRNGLTVINSHAKSKSWTQGTKGSVFVVGSDSKGRALFVSPVFDIPTACSKPDTCSSDRRGTNQYQVNPEVSKYIAKVDVYVQDRSGGRSAREAINNTIKEACGTYDDLPASAKAGIAAETGFSGCGAK